MISNIKMSEKSKNRLNNFLNIIFKHISIGHLLSLSSL